MAFTLQPAPKKHMNETQNFTKRALACIKSYLPARHPMSDCSNSSFHSNVIFSFVGSKVDSHPITNVRRNPFGTFLGLHSVEKETGVMNTMIRQKDSLLSALEKSADKGL